MKKFLYFFKYSKIKMIFILSILLFIYISISAFSYCKSVSSNIANSVLRLHVIANSDSKEDQDLKYLVRNSLIKYMNSLCINSTSKEDSILIVASHINEFKKIAENTIKENGFSYNVNISLGNFEFPTKKYGDISFPAGYYDALKVEIGDAKGQNWWCVMFPPLCFVDISSGGIVPDESKNKLQNSMNEEDFALISSTSSSTIQFKFKLIELFNKSGLITAKK